MGTKSKRVQYLQEANTELHARVTKVEKENRSLNNRVCQLEDKLLEGNVVVQGVPDSIWESTETTKEKILAAISHTIGGDTQEEKMDLNKQAKSRLRM